MAGVRLLTKTGCLLSTIIVALRLLWLHVSNVRLLNKCVWSRVRQGESYAKRGPAQDSRRLHLLRIGGQHLEERLQHGHAALERNINRKGAKRGTKAADSHAANDERAKLTDPGLTFPWLHAHACRVVLCCAVPLTACRSFRFMARPCRRARARTRRSTAASTASTVSDRVRSLE